MEGVGRIPFADLATHEPSPSVSALAGECPLRVFYNENDPFAAAWLRELIAEGLIAPGVVDERDIRDIRPDELAGFVQCHFFAGFGTWSLALRQAGVPDDRPVWTASCPCPPFSSAGPNFRCPECDTRSPVPNAVRTGAFDCIRCGHEWQADARHLFPELFRLVRECGPKLVLGEQVASNDGRTWLDIVSASLEMLGYAVGAPDTCAAGFGAPHIRQRLYWVADADDAGLEGRGGLFERAGERAFGPSGMGNRLAHSAAERHEWTGPARGGGHGLSHLSTVGGMAEADGGHACAEREQRGGEQRQLAQDCGTVRLADTDCTRRSGLEDAGVRRPSLHDPDGCDEPGAFRPGPTNGLWRDVDWLGCTDGKWRPVEPGTFPLADAGTFRNRVAELRGAGNAINLAQAQGFIEAVMDVLASPEREAA